MSFTLTNQGRRLHRQWLYLREPFVVSITEAEAGAGLTVAARLCASDVGNPEAIHADLKNDAITGVGEQYTFALTTATLVSRLEGEYIKRPVWLHLYDVGGSFYEVYPFMITDTDPDLLPPAK